MRRLNHLLCASLYLATCIASVSSLASAAKELPASFDLRNVDGKKLVSSVKNQSGGTCWTHGTMAAFEGNLLMTGTWAANGESGEPNMAEYHLDWWNGFNQHHNADSDDGGGLTVHQGGDYRVAAAYLSRGGGAVRDSDAQSYTTPPEQTTDDYHYYYVRDIEWFSAGKNLENIDKIKTAIKENGVIGTALAWSTSFYSNNTFYQPVSSTAGPNHAVSIVGWDDDKETQASKPGAWLVKNSWGTSWGNGGYFWISYYDKVAAQHPEMGAVSFKNVERMKYSHVYYHDYHGWRDTKKNVTEVFNVFQSKQQESLKSVSFYTAKDNVEYTAKIYKTFQNGQLSGEVSVKEGVIENSGFHTVDLLFPVKLAANEKFYVYVYLSEGGHAFDKTSNVPVLLGGEGRPTVPSSASAGESYYRSGNSWVDLTQDDDTANFCVKALAVN